MKNINVMTTKKELEFIINKIHVDNSFRKRLEIVLKENKK